MIGPSTSILVTGGTGSFGQAFVRRAVALKPKRLVVYSRGEHLQETMAREFPQDCMRYYLGDVRDSDRLEMAMRDIDIVIHAAALKIIPKCEIDPIEAIKTNVGGATNVITAALRTGVRKVIALSTDKAVSPINLYGSSKLAAERLFVAANNLSGERGARFSLVRYGNVAGSRGSVIPLFRQLAAARPTLPVTHPDMTRFWITLDQAVDLVISAISWMRGGEIYIPKMPSFRITDLAAAFGREIDVVGIRHGEKLHEDMITVHEARMTVETLHGYEIMPPWRQPTRTVPAGFRYCSDANGEFLSVDDLRRMVA